MKFTHHLLGALCVVVLVAGGCKKENEVTSAEVESGDDLAANAALDAEEDAKAKAEAAAAAPKVEPCSLVSKDRLSELTGVPLQEGKVVKDAEGVARCTYDRAGGDVLPGVSIAVQTGDTEQLWQNRTVIPGGQEVQGLGEKAQWQDTTKELHVLKGQQVLSIAYPIQNGREGAEKVAKEILQKM